MSTNQRNTLIGAAVLYAGTFALAYFDRIDDGTYTAVAIAAAGMVTGLNMASAAIKRAAAKAAS